MIQNKENDLIWSMQANPDKTINDLIVGGLNTSNTSLNTKEFYKGQDDIKDFFKNPDGTFDEKSFNRVYDAAQINYNYMAQVDNNKINADKLIQYSRTDTLAPKEQRQKGPRFTMFSLQGPSDQSMSTIQLGRVQQDKQKFSIAEIAQTQKVDNMDGTFSDSPNDSFWGHFFDPLVLAQWDYDADENGNVTSDPNKVVYKKGQLKLNENNKPYYEKLNGRSPYGKKILNKGDVLTTDGSWLNDFDFFDSDDIEQKSVVGVLARNTALIGSMFLPYVGPVIAGLTMGINLLDLGSKLDKILTGSENSTLSNIEGWAKSMNRQYQRTEYAETHPWSYENVISSIADLMGQLKEQRAIFNMIPFFQGKGQYVENIVSGKYIKTGDLVVNSEKMIKAVENTNKAMVNTKFAEIMKKGLASGKPINPEVLSKSLAYSSAQGAKRAVEQYFKNYQSLGGQLSKVYMAGLISSSMYEEAKLEGLNDFDAAALTLGRFAAEMALLNTPVGNAIFPELRVAKLQDRQLAKILGGVVEQSKKIGNSKAEKINWFKSLVNKGGKLADKGASIATIKGTSAQNIWNTLGASFANGVETGLINDIEEFLNDFSKSCYNAIAEMNGGDKRLTSWENKLDRYGMGMVSGVLGGTLTSALSNYSILKNSITTETAMQTLIHKINNGEIDNFKKIIDTTDIGNKALSATKYNEETHSWEAGTETDNQDLSVKQAIKQQIDLIQNILKAEGTNLKDSQFLDKLTLGDLRFAALSNSATAGRFLREFNTLNSKLVQLTTEIENLQIKDLDTNKTGKVEDYEKRHNDLSDSVKTQIKAKESELKEVKNQIQDLLEGKRTPEFIADALFEMTPFGQEFSETSFKRYAESVEDKNFNSISKERQAELKKQYDQLANDRADKVHLSSQVYQHISRKVSNLLSKYQQDYDQINSAEQSIRNLLDITERHAGINDLLEYMSRDDSDKLAYLSNIFSFTGRDILENFTPFEKIQTLQEEKQKLREEYNNTQDKAKRNQLTKEFDTKERQLVGILKDFVIENAQKLIDPIIQQPFLNPLAKNNLSKLVSSLQSYITITNSDIAQEYAEQWLADIAEDGNMMPIGESTPEINQTIKAYNTRNKAKTYLNEVQEKLSNLSESPIIGELNKFALAIGNNLNFSQLLLDLNERLNQHESDLSQFGFDTDLLPMLDNALTLVKLFSSTVEGAKTIELDAVNLYGYNHTANEVNTKLNSKGWENLIELDETSANIILNELSTLYKRLNFFKQVYTINQGRLLKVQDDAAINKNYLTYSKLTNILAKALPDGDKKDKFLEVLNSAQTYLDNYKQKNLDLSYEEKLELEKERQQIDDAIYDLFQDITVEELTPILKKFDIYTDNDLLLTQDSKQMDDITFIWWLASRAAIKSSNFYNEFKNTLATNIKNQEESKKLGIAPIPTQELAIFNDYAFLANKEKFNIFQKAINDIIKGDFESGDITSITEILNKVNPERANKRTISAEELEKIKPFGNLMSNAVRYDNIILTEGIAGSGKTQGIFKTLFQMLKTNYPEFLNNVVIVNKTKESAETLGNDSGLEKYTSYNHADFMKNVISTHWDGPKHTFNFDEYNVPKSDIEVNKTDTPPSLIIIDEVTNLSIFDLDAIDKFANENNIKVLVAGDTNQSGINDQVDIKDLTVPIGITKTLFVHNPKLGISMRTANIQMVKDVAALQAFVQDSSQKGITLHYYQTEDNLYGNKVITYGKSIPQKEVDSIIDTFKNLHKKHSDATFGYIYQSLDSEVYKAIDKLDPDQKWIKRYSKNDAQGLEGDYYLIELDPKSKSYKKDINTAITRTKIGSIVVAPMVKEGEENSTISIESKQEKSTHIVSYPYQQVLIYSKQRLDILNEIIKDGKNVEFNNVPKTQAPKVEPPIKREDKVEGEFDQTEEDENPFANNALQNDNERKAEADKETEENNNTSNLPQPTVKAGETIPVYPLLYTFNTFAPGFQYSITENTVQIIDRNNSRIDNLNGILKILGINSNEISVSDFNKYKDLLAAIQNTLLTIPEKTEAINKIKYYLKQRDNSNYYITFAYRSSIDLNNRNYPNKPWRLHQSSEEKLFDESTYSNDIDSKNFGNKQIYAIIGKDNSDILEVPLFTLSSPLSIMQTKDKNGNFIYGEAYDLYTWALSKNLKDPLGYLLKELSNKPEYKEFVELIKLYRYTGWGVGYFDQNVLGPEFNTWMPAQNLRNTGPNVVTKAGQLMFQNGLNYEQSWITLEDFVKNPRFSVSPIVSFKSHKDAKKFGLKAGYPYVIVGLKGENDLLAQARYQAENKDAPKKVVIVSIVPEKASVEQYIDNLYKVINEKGINAENIGNQLTSYQILNLLTESQLFYNWIESQYPKRLNLIHSILRQVNEAPNKVEILKNGLDKSLEQQAKDAIIQITGKESKLLPVYQILDSLLKDIVYPHQENGIKNLNNLNQINSVIGDKVKIYRGFRFGKASESSDQNGFNIIKQDNHKVDGYNFYVHGKIDTPIYIGDNLISIVENLNKKMTHDGTSYRSDDTAQYIYGNSNLVDIPPVKSNSEVVKDFNLSHNDGNIALLIKDNPFQTIKSIFNDNLKTSSIWISDRFKNSDGDYCWKVTRTLENGNIIEYYVFEQDNNNILVKKIDNNSVQPEIPNITKLDVNPGFFESLSQDSGLKTSLVRLMKTAAKVNATVEDILKVYKRPNQITQVIGHLKELRDKYTKGDGNFEQLQKIIDILEKKTPEKQEDNTLCQTGYIIPIMLII